MTPATPGQSSTGLDPKVMGVLAYLFGCIGGIALLILERQDRYVRFHAMQSTLTFLAVLVAALIVGSVPWVGWLLNGVLSVGAGILWLLLMYKAFSGERYKLPYIGDLAERQIQ